MRRITLVLGLASPAATLAQPAFTQPAFTQPAFAQPAFAQPAFAQPGQPPVAGPAAAPPAAPAGEPGGRGPNDGATGRAPERAPERAPGFAPGGSPGRGSVDLLVRQAEYWLGQDRADLAALSIERALAVEPRNPAALGVAARVEAARANRVAAAGYLARLRAAGGTEEQQAAVDSAVRGATIDRAALEDARRLARDGRGAEAVARYRALFGADGPPEVFALEYYQTLAGTDAGAEEGRRGLARLADRPGADARARLAYAEVLTYTPQTRAEGVRRLAALAEVPANAAQARRAWRQAVIWSLGDPAATPLVEAYLQRFQDDAELRRRADAARPPPPDTGFPLRQEGFARLEAGNTREATRQFEAALAANPNDADALGGLGLARLREGRQAEARGLLERAIAADPARAPQWQRALDGAAYGAELAEGRGLLRAGRLDEADLVLRRASRRDAEDKTDAETLLGELALRRGDPAAAEQRFRTALARRPGFAPAQTGLNQALRAQGRLAEAPIAPPRPAGSARGGGIQDGPDGFGPGQAGQLRAEAARSGDPGVASAILRNALAVAPNDPWVRLDLARALRRQGRAAEGRAIVEELAARDGSSDAILAAALLADEEGRPSDAEAFLDRIPPARRTPDTARLAARVRTQGEIARAAALLPGSQGEGRQRLLMLAARPDPSGATPAAVIRAFADAGDRYGAAEAARVGQTVNRAGGVRPQIAIAGALLAAGLETEAAGIADAADRPGLTAEQRRDLASLRVGIGIRASDRLNEEGNQAEAFERLRPLLAANPDSDELRLALARLYQGGRQPREALRIAETLLQRDPRDLNARRAAVEAAIALRDRERAETLVREAVALSPRDARATVLEARVARAFGDDPRAQRALATAEAQRAQELGGSQLRPAAALGLPPAWVGQENPFVRGGGAVRGQLAAGPSDPVAREIAAQRALIADDQAVRLAANAGGRQRSGTSGLDRLEEISGTLSASVAPGLLGGRLTAAVTPATITSGTLPAEDGTRRRFGTNILRTTPLVGRQTSASGAGLGLLYQSGSGFRADVGTSPLGFHFTNVVGGIEIAPLIGDSLRLRLTGERRTVTDSLLSWSGVRDEASGRYWGGVVRTGGRAQVEIPLGPGFLYAGGGYSRYTGTGVAANSRIEAGAGVGYPLLRSGDSELTSGVDLVYFSFANNLRFFTLGQGGYFSPQSYTAINIPLDYRNRYGDLTYRVGVSAGYATFREDGSRVFPNDPGLQTQLENQIASGGGSSTVFSRYPSLTRSGFVGSIRGDVEYALTPTLSLGGAFRFDKAPQFDETRVSVRLNNRF